MKRTLLILSLIVSVIVVNAQQTPKQRAMLEADFGIRDIRLKSHMTMYQDLYMVYIGNECITGYERRNENLYFGNVLASEIIYWYANDLLVGFTINFKNGNSHQNLADSFWALYGKPKFKTRSLENYGKPGEIAGFYLWKAKSFYLEAGETGDIEETGNVRYISFYLKENLCKCNAEKAKRK